MSKLPDLPGSARARMWLIAVLLLAAVTARWAIEALGLLLLPMDAPKAASLAMVGAVYLAVAATYAVVTWLVVRRSRWGHRSAAVVAALGLVFGFYQHMTWLHWLVLVLNLAAVVLLILTVPRAKPTPG